jgi:predicted small lipoprotein YifL
MKKILRPLILAALVLSSAACGDDGKLVGDGSEDVVAGDDAQGEDTVGEDLPVDDAAPEDVPGEETVTRTCPGYVKPPFVPPGSGADCRSGADCTGEEFCWLPGMTICGACPVPIDQCVTDEDCSGGVCVEDPMFCDSCPQEPGTICIPRCTAGSCLEGELCEETTGHCVPVLCTDGYSCPPNSRCGGEGEGDGHRCVTLRCSVDTDCDCGVCIGGVCMDGPGACSGRVA